MSRSSHLVRRTRVALLAAALCLVPALVPAADLQPHTAQAFDRYARSIDTRLARELAAGRGFLALDFDDPAASRAIRRDVASGEVMVMPLSERGPDGDGIDVPDGLIHHWRGVILVPGVSLDQVLAELQRPSAGRHVQQDVVESRVLSRDGDRSRVFLRLVRKQIVTVTYDTEHEVRYVRVDPRHAWSRSVSLRIAEVAEAGTPDEYEKPVGQDRGFMWRLNSYWRYEQVPEGVMIELESLTLSRDIPSFIKPIARPIINRIARESMARTLESVRARVLRSAGHLSAANEAK
jgi:hypothetical protein